MPRQAMILLTTLLISAAIPPVPTVAAEPRAEVNVAAAISLKDAFDEIAKNYEAREHVHVALTYGASGQLLAQIKAGAPADVFVSAAAQQVDDLERAKLLAPGSRRVIVRNRLVLIVPRDARDVPATLADLADATRFHRIAIGEPRTVPAGQYAMQAITTAGLADQLKPRLVMGLNVRQVLEYVRRGEADAGLVYRTDALIVGDAVKTGPVVEGHDPVEYPGAALTNAANGAAAAKFLEYLTSSDAAAVFTRFGFDVAPPTTAPAR